MTALREAPTLTIGGDLVVNRLGYGALHLTGPGYWGPPSDPDNAIRVLRRAVELGVTFIDTADSYGPGDNEQIISRALYPYPDGLVVSTKGGMLRSGPMDWSRSAERPYISRLCRPEYLRQQVELSLRNLRVDRIDLYQLHSIDPAIPLADQLGELVRLQEQGKIRHIGISNQPQVTMEQLREAREVAEIVAVENLYHIGDRASEDVLNYAETEGLVFIPFFPLGSGELLRPSSALARFARGKAASPAQLALAWLLRRSPRIMLIPGTSSITHLEENLNAAEVSLTEEEWAALEDLCSQESYWRPGDPTSRPTELD
jgi:pyridoxine 4-dehydrogenase